MTTRSAVAAIDGMGVDMAHAGRTTTPGACGGGSRRLRDCSEGARRLRDSAVGIADEVACEIMSMPEAEILRTGTTKGVKVQGVTMRDKILIVLGIVSSTAFLSVLTVLAC